MEPPPADTSGYSTCPATLATGLQGPPLRRRSITWAVHRPEDRPPGGRDQRRRCEPKGRSMRGGGECASSSAAELDEWPTAGTPACSAANHWKEDLDHRRSAAAGQRLLTGMGLPGSACGQPRRHYRAMDPVSEQVVWNLKGHHRSGPGAGHRPGVLARRRLLQGADAGSGAVEFPGPAAASSRHRSAWEQG